MGLAQVDLDDESSQCLVGRHTGFGFAAPDPVAAHEEPSARGVSFPVEPSKQRRGGFMALFAEPDCNACHLARDSGETTTRRWSGRSGRAASKGGKRNGTRR